MQASSWKSSPPIVSYLDVAEVITMFQVLLRDQWADAIVWPLVQKAQSSAKPRRPPR